MKEYITLNTGAQMPMVGLGTWKATPREVGRAVEYALVECGYKHIDCAPIYANEPEVGEALTNVFSKGIERESIFITSKLWNYAHAREKIRDACKKTLHSLKLEYLDLYLMHW